MDDVKWQSLNQLLKDISELNLESEDSIRLLSQLVLELVSEHTSMRIGNSHLQLEETSLINQNEELE